MQTVRVWDLPLRLFHWLIVLCLTAAYVTGKLGGLWYDWHGQIGMFILALLVFRITWGFVGSGYSRFSSALSALRTFTHFTQNRMPGHNPLAALAVFSMLGIVSAQALTGLFSLNDEIDFYGPLHDAVSAACSRQLSTWHETLSDVLIVLVALHVCAIVYYAFCKRINLMLAMLTGKLRQEHINPHLSIHGGGPWAFVLAIIFALAGYWLIHSNTILQWLLNKNIALCNALSIDSIKLIL